MQFRPLSFDVVPAGEYEAVITDSEMKSTLAGTGRYLNLTLQILNGPCQNRKVFDKLNLDNPSDKAVQIARGTLSAICRAVGVLTPRRLQRAPRPARSASKSPSPNPTSSANRT